MVIINKVLVGGWATRLKNMKVSWDDEIPDTWKHKKNVPKPPTRICDVHLQKTRDQDTRTELLHGPAHAWLDDYNENGGNNTWGYIPLSKFNE